MADDFPPPPPGATPISAAGDSDFPPPPPGATPIGAAPAQAQPPSFLHSIVEATDPITGLKDIGLGVAGQISGAVPGNPLVGVL